MGQERRMILSLIAAGRITAGEAERLLAATAQGREWLWIAAACVAAGAAQMISHGLLENIGHMVQTLAPAWNAALQHTTAEVLKGMGGWQ